MFEMKKYEDDNFYMLRWTARIFAIACLAILSLFIFGESIEYWSKITFKQAIGLLFFPVGLVVGLILAWWREILGGTISVVSVICFYVIYGWFSNNSLALGWWFIVFAIPGILFLTYGIVVTGGRAIDGKSAQT